LFKLVAHARPLAHLAGHAIELDDQLLSLGFQYSTA
jgi:hypothetical protein